MLTPGVAGLELRAGAGGRCARTGSVPNPRVMEVIVPRWRGELTPMREAKESQDQHSAARRQTGPPRSGLVQQELFSSVYPDIPVGPAAYHEPPLAGFFIS